MRTPMHRLTSALTAIAIGTLAASAAHGAEPSSIIDQAADAISDAVEDAGKAAASAGKAMTAPNSKKKSARRKNPPPKEDGIAAPEQAAAPAKAQPEKALVEENGASTKAATRKRGKAREATSPAPTPKTAPTGKPLPIPDGRATAQPDSKAPTDPAAKAPDGKTPDGKTDAAAKKPEPPTEWPAADIAAEKARCTEMLRGLEAVTVPEASMRKGDCGALAPVRLLSIGKAPEVALSPPAVVTCDMVVALHTWMRDSVQPAAKKHLGAEVVRIDNMSDYSCRMAYGRVGNKLSEHGKANALDVRGFVTAKAKTAYVLEEWGETRRDVAARIAAIKAAQAKAEADRIAAEEAARDNLRDAKGDGAKVASAPPPAGTATDSGQPGAGLAKLSLADGRRRVTVTLPGAPPKPGTAAEQAAARRHLGGPGAGARELDAGTQDGAEKGKGRKGRRDIPVTDDIPMPAPKTKTAAFLHEVHRSACQIFGTTLGPEANEAHRNHFHVDMAPRKFKKICD